MTVCWWGHLPSPPFSTQTYFLSFRVLYSLWVWSQRWRTPSPPGPCLPFSTHSAIHQGIVILPCKHLLHLPPSTLQPLPSATPLATASLLAPGSLAGPSACNPIIMWCLKPSAAPCCTAENCLVVWPCQLCQPHSLPASPVALWP